MNPYTGIIYYILLYITYYILYILYYRNIYEFLYRNKRRTDKKRTKLTDTTSIHTNKTKHEGVIECIFLLKQLS